MDIDALTEMVIIYLNKEYEEDGSHTLSQYDEKLIHDVFAALKNNKYIVSKAEETPEQLTKPIVIDNLLYSCKTEFEAINKDIENLTAMVNILMQEREQAALKRIKAGERYSHEQ
jgi:hypothetical protein